MAATSDCKENEQRLVVGPQEFPTLQDGGSLEQELSSQDLPSDARARNDSLKELPEYLNTVTDSLASGIKCNYLTDVEKAKSRVGELIHNQDVLRESIQQELYNIEEYKLTEDITRFTQDLRLYQAKLLNIKKDINNVTDKVSKMKKRAVKLQIGKQKEEVHKAKQKQKDLEFQKQLTAKPAAAALDNYKC